MADVRKLLRQAQLSKSSAPKVTHPLAKYNNLNQLLCVVCKTLIKSEALWNPHLASKGHNENVTRLKSVASAGGAAPRSTAPGPRSVMGSSASNPNRTNIARDVEKRGVKRSTPEEMEIDQKKTKQIKAYQEENVKDQSAGTATTGLVGYGNISESESENEESDVVPPSSAQTHDETTRNESDEEEEESTSSLPPGFFESSKADTDETPSTDTKVDEEQSDEESALPSNFFDSKTKPFLKPSSKAQSAGPISAQPSAKPMSKQPSSAIKPSKSIDLDAEYALFQQELSKGDTAPSKPALQPVSSSKKTTEATDVSVKVKQNSDTLAETLDIELFESRNLEEEYKQRELLERLERLKRNKATKSSIQLERPSGQTNGETADEDNVDQSMDDREGLNLSSVEILKIQRLKSKSRVKSVNNGKQGKSKTSRSGKKKLVSLDDLVGGSSSSDEDAMEDLYDWRSIG